MTEIRFYHLTTSPLEHALPQLLEKVAERGWKAVVMASTEERVEALTQHLWTYRENSFLAHGNAKDGMGALQPIWLTAREENPNGANVLMVTDGAKAENVNGFELVCEVFDGDNADAVAEARTRWGTYKAAGHTLTYWQQGEAGWEKKQ